MDSPDYVMALVRKYGRAIREKWPPAEIDDARAEAFDALAQTGAQANLQDMLLRYGQLTAQNRDSRYELEERGKFGHDAIDLIIKMDQIIRGAVNRAPRQPRTRTGRQLSWTVQILAYTSDPLPWREIKVENIAAAGRPKEVAADYMRRHKLGDDRKVRVWRGVDADTSTRCAAIWPPLLHHREPA